MQNLKLAEFFLTLSDLNKHLEILKRPLNASKKFSPITAFNRIKISEDLNYQFIGIQDISEFMQQCEFTVQKDTLTMLIKLFDCQYQGKLNYSSFARMVLSTTNCSSSPNFLLNVPNTVHKQAALDPDIEFALCRFFYKSSQFLNRMVDEPEFKNVLRRHDTFRILDVQNKSVLDFECIREFFNKVGINILDDEIIGILRLIDINDDGKITEGDFELFIRILRGDLNEFFNKRIFKSPQRYSHGEQPEGIKGKSTAKKRIQRRNRLDYTSSRSRAQSPALSPRPEEIKKSNNLTPQISFKTPNSAMRGMDKSFKYQDNKGRNYDTKMSTPKTYKTPMKEDTYRSIRSRGSGYNKLQSQVYSPRIKQGYEKYPSRYERRDQGEDDKGRNCYGMGLNRSDYKSWEKKSKDKENKVYINTSRSKKNRRGLMNYDMEQQPDKHVSRGGETYRSSVKNKKIYEKKFEKNLIEEKIHVKKNYEEKLANSQIFASKDFKSQFRDQKHLNEGPFTSRCTREIKSPQNLDTTQSTYRHSTKQHRRTLKPEPKTPNQEKKLRKTMLELSKEKDIEKIKERVKKSFKYDYGYSTKNLHVEKTPKNQKINYKSEMNSPLKNTRGRKLHYEFGQQKLSNITVLRGSGDYTNKRVIEGRLEKEYLHTPNISYKEELYLRNGYTKLPELSQKKNKNFMKKSESPRKRKRKRSKSRKGSPSKYSRKRKSSRKRRNDTTPRKSSRKRRKKSSSKPKKENYTRESTRKSSVERESNYTNISQNLETLREVTLEFNNSIIKEKPYRTRKEDYSEINFLKENNSIKKENPYETKREDYSEQSILQDRVKKYNLNESRYSCNTHITAKTVISPVKEVDEGKNSYVRNRKCFDEGYGRIRESSIESKASGGARDVRSPRKKAFDRKYLSSSNKKRPLEEFSKDSINYKEVSNPRVTMRRRGTDSASKKVNFFFL